RPDATSGVGLACLHTHKIAQCRATGCDFEVLTVSSLGPLDLLWWDETFCGYWFVEVEITDVDGSDKPLQICATCFVVDHVKKIICQLLRFTFSVTDDRHEPWQHSDAVG